MQDDLAPRPGESAAEFATRIFKAPPKPIPPRPSSTPNPAPRPAQAPLSEADTRILQGMSKPKLKPVKATTGYSILAPSDLLASPLIRDLIRGVFPRVGIAGVIGASMSGKGFLIVDMMAVLAESGFWFGRRADKVKVIYIPLEGAGGLHKRFRAWEKRNARKYPEIGIISGQPFDLRAPSQVAALIEAIRAAGYAGGFIVIDTLAQASPGTDENSSRDMGEVIAALQEIQAALGGLVLIVHHLGKDLTRGPRGHSSFLAALDACIEVRRDGARRSWVIGKAKDDGDGEEHFFRLQVVEIGEDEDGVITSCTVEPDESAAIAVRRALPPKSGNQRLIWDAIGELLRQSKHSGIAGAPATRPCVELETAVDQLRTRLACEPKRRAERCRAAISGLVERGLLILREGWLWCA